jgi:E3 ubiquitin-protein ligase AIP2
VPKKPPASKEVVANLPVVDLNEEILEKLGSESECAVCRENLVVGDKMQELPCKHLFHPPCLKPWLVSIAFLLHHVLIHLHKHYFSSGYCDSFIVIYYYNGMVMFEAFDIILYWQDEHNSCPVCRYELRTDDHEYESRKEREKEEEEDRRGAANAVRGGEFMYI